MPYTETEAKKYIGGKDGYMSFSEIFIEQKKPLKYKINTAIEVIGCALTLSKHKIGLAFSGGKDSLVLWHIIKTNFPDAVIEVIFGNTGVEYPESLRFARKIGKEWGGNHFYETTLSRTEKDGLKYEAQREVLEWIEREDRLSEILKEDGKLKSTDAIERAATPEMWKDFEKRKLVWKKGTLMSYWWCADQYGFPILGKAASKLDARRINIDCFLRYSKSISENPELLEYYEMLKDCKISQHCCKLLKKEPSERLQAELDIDLIFKGLMAAESRTRRTNFATRGYIFPSSRPHLNGDPFYHCNPLSIWTDDDIWEYINTHDDCPTPPLYEIEYTDEDGITRTMARNGCMGCCTDYQFKNNHMSVLRKTHPPRWKAIMDYGMAKELRRLYMVTSNGQLSLLDVMEEDELLERRPCIFDDVAKRINLSDEIIQDEYDSESEDI